MKLEYFQKYVHIFEKIPIYILSIFMLTFYYSLIKQVLMFIFVT